jgi:eukaryotic-like serine/threonine-protein kinase
MQRLSAFLGELKRRRVYHVAVVYAAAAFVAAQAADLFLPRLGLPDWTVTLVVVVAVAGFPVAVILGWAFDVTPQGLRRTSPTVPVAPSPGQFRIAAGSAMSVLALVGVGWWLSQTAFGSSLPTEKRIAVLPFHTAGDDPQSQAFADGLVESLTSRLSQLQGMRQALWVIPAAEVRQLGVSSPSHARREFGVNLVITGSVRYTGDSVWAGANLVDAEGLRQLRSWTLDQPLSDVSAILTRILRSFHDLLDLELEPHERLALGLGGTDDPRAFNDQIAAQGYLQRYDRPENLNEAIDLFSSALDHDPGYGLALSGLAMAHLRRYEHGLDPADLQHAREFAERARALDHRMAQVHLTLGGILRTMGEYEAAIGAFETALELEPWSEDALIGLGLSYEAMGEGSRAEATLRRALALRPGWWSGHNALGGFYFRQGRYEDAADQFRRVLVVTPDNSRGWSNLGGTYFQLGRLDEAFEAIERSVALSPSPEGLSNLGTLYHFTDRYEEAARAYEAALELNDRDVLIAYNLGEAYRRIPRRAAEARSAYRRVLDVAGAALEMNPRDTDAMLFLASAWAHLGEHHESRSLLREALQVSGGELWVMYVAGTVYEAIGEREAAIRWISEALRRGYSREAFDRYEDYADLRADPRFLEAMAR